MRQATYPARLRSLAAAAIVLALATWLGPRDVLARPAKGTTSAKSGSSSQGNPAKGGSSAKQAAAKPALVSWEKVQAAVMGHFRKQSGWKAGDLIVREEVEAALKKIADAGWRVADARELIEAALPASSFLAKELSTPQGRKFMRESARYPGSYDLMDRLSQMARGKSRIKELIRGPDGYKLLQYMATTPGGTQLGKQLENAPKGQHFNEPTGRIYNVEQLLARLKESHARAAAAISEPAPKGGTGGTPKTK